MKILHVTQNYFPSKGGPQYIIKHVSEKLVAHYGDNVEVCTTNSMYGPESKLFKQVEPAFEIVGQVPVHRLPFSRWQYPVINIAGKVYAKLTGNQLPHSITKYRWQLHSPAINRMMASAEVDVITAKTIIYNFADYPLWRFKTKNPKPFVLYGALHLHKELQEDSPFIKRAKACDAYIANTEFERLELIKYGVAKDRIFAVGTGIEPADFVTNESDVANFRKKYNIKQDDIVVGFIGRLVKGKGVAVLLDAFRKLYAENKKVKLLLAGGTTEYVSEIKKIIAAESLPVVLIEDFDESIKPLIYHSLDVFVLASQSESFGIVFLEAWSCKKPVIGARMGAVESLLSEGKDSLLFTPGDGEQLYRQLQPLVSNKELRVKMACAGYRKVIENYTWDVIIPKYRDVYSIGIQNFKREFRS